MRLDGNFLLSPYSALRGLDLNALFLLIHHHPTRGVTRIM
jgi:hypothetical protein